MNEIERMNEIADYTSVVNEASLPKQAFSNSGDQDPMVWIKIDRGESFGGYYRLTTDNWFRQWKGSGAADGYGIMFRSFKVTGKFEISHDFSSKYKKYKVVFKFLPSKFDDPDDDKSSNWDTAKGYLFIKTSLGIEPKDVESFVKSKMKGYTP